MEMQLLFILATCATLAYSAEPIQYNVKDLGGELQINCTAEVIQNTELSHWVLTDLTVLPKDTNNGEFKSQGMGLHIMELDENSIGDYFCVLTKQDPQGGNSTLLYFKSTVSKELDSLWTQFRTQTIVGVVAAAVTLVVMIGLCLVWRYRWRPEEKDIVAVNGGYDTADGYRSADKIPEKTSYTPENETGFVNESFTNSAPQGRHSVIVDDTKF